MTPDLLVVGLGNPGEKYALTRHNIGWLVCLELCRKYGRELKPGKGQWYETRFRIASSEILLMLPTTYMNNSGEALKDIMSKYSIHQSRVLAVVDELNFPVGRIHLKGSGSDGGHNGLKSINYHLNSQEYWRLRCGIDRKFGPGEMADYVLSPFAPEEIEERDRMILRGVRAIEYIAKNGFSRAMSEVNSGRELNT